MRYIARLKYTDKAAFEADALAKGLIDEEGQQLPVTTTIVHLGTIYKENGTDGEGLPIMEAVDGYHVDVEIKEPIDFGAALTAPNTPRHGVKWAQGAVILTAENTASVIAQFEAQQEE